MTIEAYMICGVISYILLAALGWWRKAHGADIDDMTLREWLVAMLTMIVLWPLVWLVIIPLLGLEWFLGRKL